MNKFLLMSAAAVLSTSAAYASQHAGKGSTSGHTSFYSTNGSGGAYCNEFTATWTNKVYYGNSDSLGEYCGSYYAGDTSYGAGFAGKVKGMGATISLPASIATLEGYPTYGSTFVVGGKSIKTGESLVGWGTYAGGSLYEFSAGAIELGQAPHAKLIRENGKAVPVQKLLKQYALAHGMPWNKK